MRLKRITRFCKRHSTRWALTRSAPPPPLIPHPHLSSHLSQTIPINDLVRGKYRDNLEWMQWLKQYWTLRWDPTALYEALPSPLGPPPPSPPPSRSRPRRAVNNVAAFTPVTRGSCLPPLPRGLHALPSAVKFVPWRWSLPPLSGVAPTPTWLYTPSPTHPVYPSHTLGPAHPASCSTTHRPAPYINRSHRPNPFNRCCPLFLCCTSPPSDHVPLHYFHFSFLSRRPSPAPRHASSIPAPGTPQCR